MVETPETLAPRKPKRQRQNPTTGTDKTSCGSCDDSRDDSSDASDSDSNGIQVDDSLNSFKNESVPSYSIDGVYTPSPSTAHPFLTSSLGASCTKDAIFPSRGPFLHISPASLTSQPFPRKRGIPTLTASSRINKPKLPCYRPPS